MVEKFKDLPFAEYMAKMKQAIGLIPEKKVEEAIMLILKARKEGGCIYCIGNGGSAATASHFVNELWKGCSLKGKKGFKAICLSDNIPNFSAFANDEGYENVFCGQLEGIVTSKDLLFAISSSGNSKNILKAVEVAQNNGAKAIGLTGFSGGKLKQVSDVSIHLADDHYGRVEDAHMIVCHYVGNHLRRILVDQE